MKAREIRARYKKIDPDYGSEGRNVYRCPHRHDTLTRHIHKGVTPMFIDCPICKERATSMMYAVSQEGSLKSLSSGLDIEPVVYRVWVRPSLSWVLQNKKANTVIEHILDGGLLLIKTSQVKRPDVN